MTTNAVALTLKKSEKLNLSKTVANLDKIRVELGWKARVTSGDDFDLDASAILVQSNDKVPTNGYFCYYGQPKTIDLSVETMGDDLKGGSGTDVCETLKISLSRVDSKIDKIVLPVTIHEAKARRQSFGDVGRAFVQVVDENTGNTLCRYDLADEFTGLAVVIFAELRKNGAGEWNFHAVGQGFPQDWDLGTLARNYGVNIG
jgi:tellurium resistance protein TerD